MTDADDRARLFDVLGTIDRLWQRQVEAKPGTPAPGSLEEVDRQHALGAHPVIPTTIKLAVALDHLIVWAKFYRELPDHPLPGYSHLSLLRPSFEASPQIRWVLDPSVDTTVRIGRALGVELSNLRWRAKVEKNIREDGWPMSGSFVSAETRMEEIKVEAATAGITVENAPETTTLVRTMSPKYPAGDVMFWQVASGVLHAQEWASLLGDHTVTAEGEAFQIIEHTADVGFALTATVAAVHQFELALRALEDYLRPSKQ
jgi:hypothetical protein